MRRFALLLLSLGLLSACGAAAPATSAPTASVSAPAATSEPVSTAAPAPTGDAVATIAPAATPVPVPTAAATTALAPTNAGTTTGGTPAAGTAPIADTMTALAKADLAKRANVTTDNIQVQSIEEVEWNNSALGCAKPDTAYMQVITSGYKILLVANGTTYDYRTDTRGTVMPCENAPKPKS